MRVLVVALVFGLAGCFHLKPSQGGAQKTDTGGRVVDPAAIAVPEGYRVETVATGLTFPTSLTFDDQGRVHVTESGYVYGELFLEPRLLRIEPDGSTKEVYAGDNGPWGGVVWHDGAFIVAEGGQEHGGRITRITPQGERTVLIEHLPSLGDHHTNGPAVGPDGRIYFGQGTATNSAVVGTDNADFGWLKRHPQFHDLPCRDITLTGKNFKSPDPLKPDANAPVETGAYVPFGTRTTEGQRIAGVLPCSGAVMSIAAQGGDLRLEAWGLRNPFGLAFAPDGTLYVSENGYDERGSRPVFGAPDNLWKLERGRWYGWPDYGGPWRLDEEPYRPHGDDGAPPLLTDAQGKPPTPLAQFAVHSSTNGIDVSRSAGFGHEGQVFAAQFGDMAPKVGKVWAPVGFKVVRVEPDRHIIHDFAVNHGEANGPASMLESGGLERPVAVRFSPDGSALYIVDFGQLKSTAKGHEPQPGTGVIWRVVRAEGGAR